MKNTLILLAIAILPTFSIGQTINKEQVVELGEFYSNYMFLSSPSKSVIKAFGEDFSEEMKTVVEFVKELTKTKNDLLTDDFLVLPDTSTLLIVYAVDAMYQNRRSKTEVNQSELVESVINGDIPYNELVDEYYQTLFSSVSNKNKPFNLSKVNFEMKK